MFWVVLDLISHRLPGEGGRVRNWICLRSFAYILHRGLLR